MKRTYLFSAIATVLLTLGCGPDNAGPAGPTPTPDLNCQALSDADARAACETYPRMLDVQTGLMNGVCSPNPNVCHQTNNYPDMHTAGNLLSMVGEPCNLELPDPLSGWDSCELPPDRINGNGGFSSEVAWIDPGAASGQWTVGLRTAPTTDSVQTINVYDSLGGVVLQAPPEWLVEITLTTGSTTATITIGDPQQFVVNYVDAILATVVGGDRNRNGNFGAEDTQTTAGAVVWAGDLNRSYLWGRITGTVPGSRMPLANGPVVQSQYIALACWIEGLDQDATKNQATDYINYENCSFAANPINYEITDF